MIFNEVIGFSAETEENFSNAQFTNVVIIASEPLAKF